MQTRSISAIMGLFVLCGTLEARPVAVWNYRMLMEKSDLVVIGKVVSAKASDEVLEEASFRDKPQRVTIEAIDGVREKQERLEGPPDYLLFLRARKDGRFEPVTGQVDSSFSVRKVAPAD